MGGVAPRLAIGRRLLAVQVALAHGQRVQPEPARNVAHDGLDHHHALGPAKAPKRRVALGVELAAVGGNGHIFQKVGVIGVEDRAV